MSEQTRNEDSVKVYNVLFICTHNSAQSIIGRR